MDLSKRLIELETKRQVVEGAIDALQRLKAEYQGSGELSFISPEHGEASETKILSARGRINLCRPRSGVEVKRTRKGILRLPCARC